MVLRLLIQVPRPRYVPLSSFGTKRKDQNCARPALSARLLGGSNRYRDCDQDTFDMPACREY